MKKINSWQKYLISILVISIFTGNSIFGFTFYEDYNYSISPYYGKTSINSYYIGCHSQDDAGYFRIPFTLPPGTTGGHVRSAELELYFPIIEYKGHVYLNSTEINASTGYIGLGTPPFNDSILDVTSSDKYIWFTMSIKDYIADQIDAGKSSLTGVIENHYMIGNSHTGVYSFSHTSGYYSKDRPRLIIRLGNIITINSKKIDTSDFPGVAISASTDLEGQGNGTSTFYRYYNDGQSFTFTAPSNTGDYEFVKWQRNGTDFSTNESITTSISDDTVFTAIYEEKIYHDIVSSIAQGNGSIDPLGTTSILKGNSQTYTIIPDNLNYIDKVEVDGFSQGEIATYTFSNVNKDYTITAYFKPKKSITAAANNPAWGSITKGGQGAVYYKQYETPQYDINAFSYNYIKDIFLDSTSLNPTHPTHYSYTFPNVNENHEIYVEFEESFVIYFAITKQGVVEAEIPNNSFNDFVVPVGSPYTTQANFYFKRENHTQIFNFIPDDHYEMVNFKLDNINYGAISSFTFDGPNIINRNMTGFVYFNNIKHNITVTTSQYGYFTHLDATPRNSGFFTYNEHFDSPRFEFHTDSNAFGVKNVIVDGTSLGPLNFYEFINLGLLDNYVTTDHTLEIIFAERIESIDPIFFGTEF